jgi:hypothetical protein
MAFASLSLIACGCVAGLAAGLCTPARRGPERLWDAVLAGLRLPEALLLVPLVAWALAPSGALHGPLLASAFLPAWLHTVRGMRRVDAETPVRRSRLGVAVRDMLKGVALSWLLAGLLLAAGALRALLRN